MPVTVGTGSTVRVAVCTPPLPEAVIFAWLLLATVSAVTVKVA
jgi:hypothetical protein